MVALVVFCLAGCTTGKTHVLCSTRETEFTDGSDGSTVKIRDAVPIFMKRDLSTAKGTYTWKPDGSGEWVVGDELTATDGTSASEVAVEALRLLEKIVVQKTATNGIDWVTP